MKKITIFALSLLLFLCTACYIGTNKVKDFTFDYETFKLQHEKWLNANISSYTYNYYSAGFSLYDYNITVEGNVVVGAYDKQYDKDIFESHSYIHELSINEIFNQIENKYLARIDGVTDRSHYLIAITITYDEVYGFPVDVDYDYYTRPGLAVDGNFMFKILDFSISEK